MKRTVLLLLILLSALSLFANQSSGALRRYAMFVGSNDGGHDRVRLRYAESDARAMAGVMQELGGVEYNDSLVLLAPTSYDLETAFIMMDRRIRQAHEEARRVEFLFYYSGHSDEQGLLLGEERVAYTDLKRSIVEIEADVNIAILDSCFSGAFTRLKGGSRQLPFMIDESIQMKGHAFLTSSSANEAAQESDHIEGSYFTHYMIAALRGAADSTRDEQVSLNEAYHYAFSETLARTETSQAGAQHPSYNIQLTGTGDLTMTDLRIASCSIVLNEQIDGRLYVRGSLGNLVAEVRKVHGTGVVLALPEGRYSLNLDTEGSSWMMNVTLRSGVRRELAPADFQPIGRERTTRRGNESLEEPSLPPVVEVPALEAQDELPVSYEPFGFTVLPGVPEAPTNRTVYNLSLNLLVGSVYGIKGAQLGTVMNITEDKLTGVQASGVGNIVEGELVGIQYSGVFNIAGGDTTAAQWAGVFNINEGNTSFLQAAGVFNMVGGTFAGVQAGGVFNMSKQTLTGVQTAGVFNMAESTVTGAQISGVFNTATKVSGAQVGVVNISEDVSGTQIGIVNISGGAVRGAQVGIVNISQDLYGIPIGLINIVENGIFRTSGWFSELGLGYVGFEMGSRYLYTLLYAGMALGDRSTVYTGALGLGLHIPVGSFFVAGDLSAKASWTGWSESELTAAFDIDELSPIWPSARIMLGVRIFGFLSLFGGVMLDTTIPGYTVATELHQGSSFTLDLLSTPMEVYPKLFAGIKF
ncbi:MAG: caspase family protein [Spirochaetaceae bacterium]|nr:MAG: caspase family protein [Spirochaetaceae bacterium]